MLDTKPLLEKITFPKITRNQLHTLQLNLGYMCNQQCQHCHVNAGPNRTEQMTDETILAVQKFITQHHIKTIDVTGGAPEMHPRFKDLIRWAREQDIQVIDRCNLTILLEDGYEYMIDFLTKQKVQIIASLPCYLEENVDKQRGSGTYVKSIQALKQLNKKGFGMAGSELLLNLVYNPQDANLPPDQSTLEAEYKQYLKQQYGIEFNNLLVITNLPIARFGSMLLSKGEFNQYMNLLQTSFQESNIDNLMCKYLISIDWQGFVYDCDFNQMLDLPSGGQKTHIEALTKKLELNLEITVAGHCYGCTAGQGSSCSGALS